MLKPNHGPSERENQRQIELKHGALNFRDVLDEIASSVQSIAIIKGSLALCRCLARRVHDTDGPAGSSSDLAEAETQCHQVHQGTVRQAAVPKKGVR
jgi:hypothetical protein